MIKSWKLIRSGLFKWKTGVLPLNNHIVPPTAPSMPIYRNCLLNRPSTIICSIAVVQYNKYKTLITCCEQRNLFIRVTALLDMNSNFFEYSAKMLVVYTFLRYLPVLIGNMIEISARVSIILNKCVFENYFKIIIKVKTTSHICLSIYKKQNFVLLRRNHNFCRT